MSARSIFISGGAGGIGLATAGLFADKGWRVGIGDVNRDALARAASTVPGLHTFVHDVCDYRRWHAVLDEFTAPSEGALEALVNNAGVLTFGLFDELDPETFQNVVDINVTGVLYGSHAAVGYLRRGDDPALINLGSSASLQAPPALALYAATKFAVRGLSEALDPAYARHGIRVACVEPYCVETSMLDADDRNGLNYRSVVADGEILSPDDVAEAVFQAASGDALHYPVGEVPRKLIDEISVRQDSNRRMWREALAIAPAGEPRRTRAR